MSLLDESTAAIYGYDANDSDGTGSRWTITNLLEGPRLIAPGQGFFVSSKVASANLEFTPDMQIEGSSDDFIAGRTLNDIDFIKIRMSTDTDSYITSIYFHSNASLGLDVGFDAAVFGGNVSDFTLYSHLVQDNEGIPMAIQAVNSGDISDVIIPLGVNAVSGLELRFSIYDMAMSTETNFYLDDMVENTSTLLTSTDYMMLTTSTLAGTGRFFLRLNEATLSTNQNDIGVLDIFLMNSSNELVVNGRLKEGAHLTLIDLQGRIVLKTRLDTSILENRINLSSISAGVYIVQIQNEIWQISKKVVKG